MAPTTSEEAPVTAAIRAALAPYPWRRFRPDLVARLALAADDRRRLETALALVPGATVGGWQRLEPADRTDARVVPLVERLARHRWSGLRLAALAALLAGTLPH